MGHKKSGHANREGKQGAPHEWSECLVNVAKNCKRWHNKNTANEVGCCNRCWQSINDRRKQNERDDKKEQGIIVNRSRTSISNNGTNVF